MIDIKPFYTPATVRSSENTSIPRNFFQTYKVSRFDEPHARRLLKFRTSHPEFNFFFYDDDAMDLYMATQWADHAIFEVYKNTVYGPSKADIWRYCILFQYGGVYLDVDSEILFNLNTIPSGIDEAIAFEGNSMRGFFIDTDWPFYKFYSSTDFKESLMQLPENEVLQWLLIFRAGHPILKRAIELIAEYAPYYKNRTFRSVMHAVMAFAGPPLFTQAVWEYRRAGGNLNQFGRDFNGLAKFKSIESPQQSVYATDADYYARKRDEKIYIDRQRIQVHMAGDCCLVTELQGIKSSVLGQPVTVEQLTTITEVDEIDLLDILERVSFAQATLIIEQCCTALKSKGILTLRVACLDKIAKDYNDGTLGLAEFNKHLFGDKSRTEVCRASAVFLRQSFWNIETVSKVLTDCQMSIVSVKSDINDTVVSPMSGSGYYFRLRAKKGQ